MNTKTIAGSIALTLAAAGAGYVETRPTVFLVTSTDGGSGCVIPDCRSRLLPSGWDEQHAPVDCLAGGPYAMGGPPRWRGCSVRHKPRFSRWCRSRLPRRSRWGNGH